MTSRSILITGGTDGIGKATALQLAQRVDDVTIVGRNAEKGHQAQQEIADRTGAAVSFSVVDMSLMSEVQRFASEYLANHSTLDCLLHCAGGMQQEPIVTDEGLELMFATQYLSRYCLTEALLPALNNGGKVMFVSGGNVTDGSVDYEYLTNTEDFGMLRTVLKTASAQSLYTLMLMTEHPSMYVYNYGPGIVRTSIGRNMSGVRGLAMAIAKRLIAVSPEQVGLEIATLLTESYESGWYKKGLKHQPYSGETFAAEQRELGQFSNNQLRSINPAKGATI